MLLLASAPSSPLPPMEDMTFIYNRCILGTTSRGKEATTKHCDGKNGQSAKNATVILAMLSDIRIFARGIVGFWLNKATPPPHTDNAKRSKNITVTIAMRKKWILKVALFALVAFGTGSAQAQKGYEVPEPNPEYVALADQVIEMQLSDPDKANSNFSKLLRKIKNKKEDLLSIGQYFLDKNVYPCARQCAEQLYTLDPLYIPGLMFNGEVCMIRKDYGSAGQKFDEVLSIDSTYVPALKRNAFVYKNVNPHVAIEMLERIKNVEPNNHVADRDLGDIYYNLDEFKDAISHYKTYFTAVTTNDSSDIRPAENYMMSLYAANEFPELGEQIDRFAALDSKDMVFKRMKFFAAVENYKLDEAKAAIGYIANKEYADSLYLYLDYFYAGSYMAELDEENALASAIDYMKQAIECDSTKVGAYKNLATYYRRNKQYDEGIETYKHYLKLVGDKAKLSDFYGLGQQYVGASQRADITPEKKAEYVAAGDAIFLQILEKNPKAYSAIIMRARLNITDGTKPEEKVKALYEEALKVMEGEEGTESAQLEAYRYLAFYDVQTDNLDGARTNCDALLKLDPNNAFAKQIDTYLKSAGK